jgi:hypothetical protein
MVTRLVWAFYIPLAPLGSLRSNLAQLHPKRISLRVCISPERAVSLILRLKQIDMVPLNKL